MKKSAQAYQLIQTHKDGSAKTLSKNKDLLTSTSKNTQNQVKPCKKN